MVIVVFSASLFEFRAAVIVLVLNALVATTPLLLQGWDSYYARTLVVLLASMVACGRGFSPNGIWAPSMPGAFSILSTR